MQIIAIEFPDHIQLHMQGADGTVQVKTVKKSEVAQLIIETKPETQSTQQTI